ncbi:MAG: S-adenosylmethionine:tRNA ribosyltransferase-isomerase, partial [Fervidobacterium sp.]
MATNINLHRLDAYDYELPEELIAQVPVEPRDHSRLMVVNKNTGEIEHRIFKDIKDYLEPGDLLVFNTSKVIPARLLGRKTTGAQVELLLLEKLKPGIWKCLVKPGKAVKEGTEIVFQNNNSKLFGKCIGRAEEGTRIIEFSENEDSIIFSFGVVPLPHYIKNENVSIDRYQTVYAKHEGSVAAPTAG